MKLALQEAEEAFTEDEIPVGAILVKDNKVVFSDHNRTRQNNDPTGHAERLVIDKLLKTGGRYLNDHTLYVTLEPCSMCAGMLVLVRLGILVYGADDPKTGATGSIYNIPSDRQLNHNIKTIRGILAEDCGELLSRFFLSKR